MRILPPKDRNCESISMRFIFLTIIVVCLSGCIQPEKRPGKQFRTASEYNNYIIERQKWVAKYISSFYDVLNSDIDSAATMLTVGLVEIEKITGEIRQMPPFNGDTAFRQAAINSFGFYKRLFEVEYPAIIGLHNKNDDYGIAEEQEEAKILNRIIKDEDKFDKQLHNRQKDFAENNNMLLTKP